MPQMIRRFTKSRRDPLNPRAYRVARPEAPMDLFQPIYDCANFSATALATSELSWYSTVRGQSTTLIRSGAAAASYTKTYRDTNMDQAGVIPTKMVKVIGISLGFRHLTEGAVTNPADREMIRSGGYLEFKIIDRLVFICPLMAIPEVNPMLGISTTANTTTAIVQTGGGGPGRDMMKLNIPITIEPYQNFTVKAIFDQSSSGIDLTNAVDVYCFLWAYVRQPS